MSRECLAVGLLTTTFLAGCRLTDVRPEVPEVGANGYRLDPGVTGYSHVLGCVTQRYVFPAPLVERAAVEAMTDMAMHSVKRTEAEGMIFLKGLLYDGRIFEMKIEPQGDHTVLQTRIDFYGDEPRTKILYDRIGARLATLPQSVNPPWETRNLSDSVLHRGKDIEGYRGAPLR